MATSTLFNKIVLEMNCRGHSLKYDLIQYTVPLPYMNLVDIWIGGFARNDGCQNNGFHVLSNGQVIYFAGRKAPSSVPMDFLRTKRKRD